MNSTTTAICSKIEEIIGTFKSKIRTAEALMKVLETLSLYEVGIDKNSHRLYHFKYKLINDVSSNEVQFKIVAFPIDALMGEQDRVLSVDDLQNNYLPYSVSTRQVLPDKK
jgi:hypothetical protein